MISINLLVQHYSAADRTLILQAQRRGPDLGGWSARGGGGGGGEPYAVAFEGMYRLAAARKNSV